MVQLVAGLTLLGSAGVVAMTTQPAAESPTDDTTAWPTRLGEDASQDAAAAESPYRLQIPHLDVDAPIVSVDTDDGVLGVPGDPAAVGWWAAGPIPGGPRGTSILAGHTNTADRGPGALKEIEALEAGDRLSVTGWGEPVHFEVTSIVRHPRAEAVPTSAFDQRVPGRLAIVSCSELDPETGTYRNNLIAYARRIETPTPDTISFDPPRSETTTP